MGIFELESREALIGTPTVSVSANPSGNVLERLEFIGSRFLSPMRLVALSLGIPLPMGDPVDRTITANTTFEDVPVHYYRNLTIAPGVNVLGRSGPMIIVVEGDLTIGEGASINASSRGGRGGSGVFAGQHGRGGYGGNLWNFHLSRSARLSYDPFFIAGGQATALGATSSFPAAYPLEGVIAGYLFSLSNNGVTSTTAANGVAWTPPSLWGGLDDAGFDWLLFRALVFAILSRPKKHPTSGGLGGGGGGSGAASYGTSISVPGARYFAGKGGDGNAGGEPGAGGLGFGGGGSGGPNGSVTDPTWGGYGGNGGGTQLWVVKRISNAGTIRSNGGNGGRANTPEVKGGGGGGGGGGCAALLYWEAFGAGVGTWEANGGLGGPGYNGANGGDGGAGMVRTVQYIVRSN